MNFNFDEESINEQKSNTVKNVIIISIILLIAILSIMLTCHIVSTDKGLKLITRTTLSFDEFFVNMDKITGVPYAYAKIKNPLACKALQKAKLIETDEEIQNRILKEQTRLYNQIMEDQKKYVKDIQDEYMSNIQRALKNY